MKITQCLLPPACCILNLVFEIPCGQAQIIPDRTLPVNSIVTPSGNINIIEGGTQAGENLFHSFQEFSISTGGEAFFNNSLTIQNIINRVTGGAISNIDGLIRANGTANLFLINPNGIIFGSNASLNIGGSFLASTATGINFSDSQFSATNPNPKSLLTISVPIGLQLGSVSAIQVQRSNLEVQNGRSIILAGGNVILDGGNLQAPGGRIELGGLSAKGNLGLTIDDRIFSLRFPDGVARGDVLLTNGARSNVRSAGGGSITINARNVDILAGSQLRSGILSGNGSVDSQAGNIEINATGKITINGLRDGKATDTGAFGIIESKAVGNGGDIIINAESIYASNRGQLRNILAGEGNAGSVIIRATDTVNFDGGDKTGINGKNTGIFTRIEQKALGKGGDIIITAKSLSALNDARLSADTFGKGDGGNVVIQASDNVSFDGASDRPLKNSDGTLNFDGGGISSQVGFGKRTAVGNGGDIIISTGSLSLTNGSYLTSTNFDRGNGGNVIIEARDTVLVDGSNGQASSGIFTRLQTLDKSFQAIGNAGSITIKTGSLIVSNGAFLSSETGGIGNAGNVTIEARDRVIFDGVGVNRVSSGIANRVEKGGNIGEGGTIEITTGSLFVTNGARLLTSTDAKGNAGNIIIKARDRVSFDGYGSNGSSSSAFTTVRSNGTGNGGNIDIDTSYVSVTNGARIEASTSGKGNGGEITVKTDTLEVLGGGQIISSSTTKNFAAGSIDINAADRVTISGNDPTYFDRISKFEPKLAAIVVGGDGSASALIANTTGGEGNIEVRSPYIILRDGSLITTNAIGSDKQGGNITLNTDVLIALENSDISANSQESRGGTVTIDASSIFGAQSRTREELETLLDTTNLDLLASTLLATSDITATGANSNLSGTIAIETPDVDPSAGLVELPDNIVDATNIVPSTCDRRNSEKSQFVVTGRGGLPPNPNEAINDEATWIDLRAKSGNLETEKSENQASVNSYNTAFKAEMIEAQEWRINSQGKVELLARSLTVTPQGFGLDRQQVSCALN